MHRVACERFLCGEAGQYRFLRDGVNRKLAEVDELSLRLHLRLSFEHGIVPVDVGGSTMRQEAPCFGFLGAFVSLDRVQGRLRGERWSQH
jgi:hypothetical protein